MRFTNRQSSSSIIIIIIITLGQFRWALKTHLFGHSQLQHRVTVFLCAVYKFAYLLTYLLILNFAYNDIMFLQPRDRTPLKLRAEFMVLYKLHSLYCTEIKTMKIREHKKWQRNNHELTIIHLKLHSSAFIIDGHLAQFHCHFGIFFFLSNIR